MNLATNVTVVDLNIHPQQLDAAATLTGNGVQTMIETALASNKWPAWQVSACLTENTQYSNNTCKNVSQPE